MKIENKVRSAFQEVENSFRLPFEVGLEIYGTQKEAEESGVKIYNKDTTSDLDDVAIRFVLSNYPYTEHFNSKDFLRASMAQGFGHFEYDQTQKPEVMEEQPGADEVYSYFKAVKNALHRGYGPDIVNLFEEDFNSPEFINRAEQNIFELENDYAKLAALRDKEDTGVFQPISKEFDIEALIDTYNKPLGEITINRSCYLLNPNIYRSGRDFVETFVNHNKHFSLLNF